MAELFLKLKTGSGYADLDCLCAFADRRIACVHAEHICFPMMEIMPGKRRLWGMSNDGICPASHPAKWFLKATKEKRIERLSRTEGQIVRMSDRDTIRFTEGVPFVDHSGKTVAINDLNALAKRVRDANQFAVFGSVGREVWYGGRTDVSEQRIDTVWQHIEANTTERRAQKTKWPAGRQDLKSHLALTIPAIDDSEAEALTETEYETRGGRYVWERTDSQGNRQEAVGTTNQDEPPDDESWQLVTKSKRRNRGINRAAVRDLLGVTDAQLDDNETAIDKRDVTAIDILFDKVKNARRPFKTKAIP